MPERRKLEAKLQALLRELSLAQECSLHDLQNYGYELAFVRKADCGNLAVIKLDNSVMTIDESGEVNSEPDIKLRD